MITDRERGDADSVHAAAWDLLPWYANQMLTREEAEQVRAHLALCEICRNELERCRSIAAAAKTDEEHAWAPSPAHFSRVMARIDAAEEQAVAPAGATRSRRQSTSWIAAVRGWIVVSPSPVRWALAMQAMLLVAGVALLATTLPQSRYETMSRQAPHVETNRAQLRVVFGDDVAVKDLGEMLHGIDSQIVSGPSPTGVYTIALPMAAKDTARVDAALAALRQNPKVLLAERDSGGGR